LLVQKNLTTHVLQQREKTGLKRKQKRQNRLLAEEGKIEIQIKQILMTTPKIPMLKHSRGPWNW